MLRSTLINFNKMIVDKRKKEKKSKVMGSRMADVKASG